MEKPDNINAIRKHDPFADSVIWKATHVALFNFNDVEQKWEKDEIDGPLFVYNRLDKPIYSLMIANRNSRNDFIEPLSEDLHINYECPYIFVRQTSGKIRGLWVYGEDQCKSLYKLLDLVRLSFGDKDKQKELDEFVLNASSNASSSSSPQFAVSSNIESDNNEKGNVCSTTSSQVSRTSRNVGGFGGPSKRCVKPLSKVSANNVKLTLSKRETYSSTISSDDEKSNTSSETIKFQDNTIEKKQSSVEDLTKVASFDPSIVEKLKLSLPKQQVKLDNNESNIMKADSLLKQYRRTNVYEKPKISQTTNSFYKKSSQRDFPLQSNTHSKKENSPDETFLSGKNTEQQKHCVGLTKEQLVQAMEYLLHNDPEFVEKIHQGYSDSLKICLKK